MKAVIEQNGIVWRLLSENDPPLNTELVMSIPGRDSFTGEMKNRHTFVRLEYSHWFETTEMPKGTYFAELPQLNREEI